MKFLILLLPLIAFCGCATIDSSDIGGHHMVSIKNSAWKLFDFIPIASGNPQFPNKASSRLFCDTVTLESNISMLDKTIEARGASGYKTLSSYITDESVFFILLNRTICHTSAELIFGGDIPSNAAQEAK